MKTIVTVAALFSVFHAGACRFDGSNGNELANKLASGDTHSYANTEKVYTTNLFLDITVSFDKKQIDGIATWDIKNPGGADKIVFDTKSLNIKKVIVDNKHEANFTFGKKDDLLGASLEIPITKKTKKIS